MHQSIATVSVSGGLADKLSAIAAAKFDGIEIFDQDLISSPLSPAQVADRCAELGLSIDLFQPVRDVEGVAPQAFAAVEHRLRVKLTVMRDLGVTTLLACSNTLPGAIDDPDLSAEQLHRLGELAADQGCRIAFEALAWGRYVSRIGQAWDIVQRADHPAVTVAVDTFHMLARGDGAEALEHIPGDQIGFLQVADAPVLGMDVLQWSRHHRVFPGQGGFDLAPLVAKVFEVGYRGPLSLEVFSDVIREADASVTALDAKRSLLHLEEELRRHWAAAGVARPRIGLFDPPPVPSDPEVGFIEIATEPAQLDVLLTAAGFRVAGRHRSKPVTWWANGGANLLTNESTPDTDRWVADQPRPTVTGVGLQVDDVSGFIGRREALLWPALPLRRGEGEAPLAGVDSPAGIHYFVSGQPGTREDWRLDFVPERTPRPAGEGAWAALDHLGYPVAFDVSEAEISFYRTLFGFLPGDVSEFIDPRGRLRSRVMHSDASSARVVLNVAEGHFAAPRRGLNQLAFGCSDVLAAATAMRAAGVPLLAVPANYYVDLDARFDLPEEQLAQWREAGVMYDRDESGGELLHVYTDRIAGAFYVELVQRSGGYDGYGAAGTPVRLAAQRDIEL